MLAFWSRAARNPGTCRCISCISNTSAITRRTSTVNIKGPWAFGTPTSTFCYTAIFVAGLAMDAKVKHNRNEQWDTAFAVLREEMKQPSEGEQRPQAQAQTRRHKAPTVDSIGLLDLPPIEDMFPQGVNWDLIYRVSGTELVDDQVFQRRQADIHLEGITESLWELLPFDSRLPGMRTLEWPANTGRDLIRFHLPPQSLWSPDHMRWTAVRKRHTWKKLAMQELSIGLLIHSMILHAGVWKLSNKNLDSLSPQIRDCARYKKDQMINARKDILDNMERLHLLKVDTSAEEIAGAKIRPSQPSIPQYSQDDDGDFYSICQQMNTAISKIFNGNLDTKSDREIAFATAKVCHNLLISTAAPDLQTFNILLSGFKRWNRPYIVDDVIAAFYYCKIRPNEITCSTILEHYVQNNRPEDFSRFVGWMRGAGDALMLARPDIIINEASEDRLVRINETKVYQKVYPTPMVFNSLMHGVLKFAGFERALDIYYEMKADGWGLDVLGLTHFLVDCIHRVDWDGGLYIWEEISSIKGSAKQSHMAKAYSQMLGLCSVTGNTAAFNQVLNDVVKRGYNRKAILSSAAKTAKLAKHRKSNLAPAWAADNLLIAVSGYLDNTKTLEDEDDETPSDEPEPFTHGQGVEQSNVEEVAPVDPEAAWSSFLEHELGENPLKKD